MSKQIKYIAEVPGAPKAVGAYSPAVIAGEMFFISGQIAINSETGKIEVSDVKGQAEQVMKNLETLLKGIGCNFNSVAKTTILLANIGDFAVINEVYARWLGDAKPARATFAVAGLPMGALVEVEMCGVV